MNQKRTQAFFSINCADIFLVSQDNRNKSKSKQMGPKQTYKLLHSKGNHKTKRQHKD